MIRFLATSDWSIPTFAPPPPAPAPAPAAPPPAPAAAAAAAASSSSSSSSFSILYSLVGRNEDSVGASCGLRPGSRGLRQDQEGVPLRGTSCET